MAFDSLAIDLSNRSHWGVMITGPGDLRARYERRDALPQPSHGDADDRASGAVNGPVDRALAGRRQALRTSELTDGILNRSGAQT
jgi:hypothetical protein